MLIASLFCKKGDKPQNIILIGEPRKWLLFAHVEFFER